MEPNLHEYPYTQYEDGCSMGCFMGMCRRAGVKLAVVGDSLQLLDKNNFVLSQVKIAIAQSALKDELGNNITAYIINAGTREDTVVFTKGNGDEIVVTVPFATTARYDKSGNEIDDYIIDVQAVGDNLAITRGDGVTYSVTCPYATKAFTDVNNKPLTTYAASMEVSGNNVVLKDGMGTVISTITVHFAERAAADENGNNIRESYASVLQAGTTTVKLIAKSGDILSEITVPYATSALKDTNGNELLKDYAETLVVDNDGKRLDLLAHDGTLLSAVTVPFSTLATDATNAIERAEIVGDQLVLTTYGGVVTRLTIPYAIRSLNDGASNEITKTYVHNVVQDPITGEITFYDAEGTALCSLIHNARVAEYDTYNNLIADYIKTLVFDNQSDYLVATHGDGTADTIVVNYATKAWKDTQGNIIKNTYIAFLANVVDNEGEWVLVAYNGEGSELFRLKVVANKAQKDQLGNVIDTFYMHDISFTNYTMNLLDAHGNTIGTVALPAVAVSAELDSNDNYKWYLKDQNGNTLSTLVTPKDARKLVLTPQGDEPDKYWVELYDATDSPINSQRIVLETDGQDLVKSKIDSLGNKTELARVTLPAGTFIKYYRPAGPGFGGTYGTPINIPPVPSFMYVVDSNKKIYNRIPLIDEYYLRQFNPFVTIASSQHNAPVQISGIASHYLYEMDVSDLTSFCQNNMNINDALTAYTDLFKYDSEADAGRPIKCIPESFSFDGLSGGPMIMSDTKQSLGCEQMGGNGKALVLSGASSLADTYGFIVKFKLEATKSINPYDNAWREIDNDYDRSNTIYVTGIDDSYQDLFKIEAVHADEITEVEVYENSAWTTKTLNNYTKDGDTFEIDATEESSEMPPSRIHFENSEGFTYWINVASYHKKYWT